MPAHTTVESINPKPSPMALVWEQPPLSDMTRSPYCRRLAVRLAQSKEGVVPIKQQMRRAFGAGIVGLLLATCSCGGDSSISAAATPSAQVVSSPTLPQVNENLSISGSITAAFSGPATAGSGPYSSVVSICRRVTHMMQSDQYGDTGLWVWLGTASTPYHFWILVPKFAGKAKTFDPAIRSDVIFIQVSTAVMMTDSSSDHWGDWKTAWITTAGTASVDSVDSVGHVVSGKIQVDMTEELQNKGTVHVTGTWSCPYDTSQPKAIDVSL